MSREASRVLFPLRGSLVQGQSPCLADIKGMEGCDCGISGLSEPRGKNFERQKIQKSHHLDGSHTDAL